MLVAGRLHKRPATSWRVHRIPYLTRDMNRLKAYLEEKEPLMPEGDYWIIETRSQYWVVSVDTARAVERVVTRLWPPRWIGFVDITGGQRRVRTELVESVIESTTAQRAVRRAFDRERNLEDKADRSPWEDCD